MENDNRKKHLEGLITALNVTKEEWFGMILDAGISFLKDNFSSIEHQEKLATNSIFWDWFANKYKIWAVEFYFKYQDFNFKPKKIMILFSCWQSTKASTLQTNKSFNNILQQINFKDNYGKEKTNKKQAYARASTESISRNCSCNR